MTPRVRGVLLVMAGVAAAALLWIGVPAVLRRLDFFRVRRVEVVGTRYLSGAEVVAAMELPRSASVFDATGPWQDAVAALAGVDEVEVTRRLPGTIRVRVREAEPVALAPSDGHLALVDARGRVLPFDATRVGPDLPVLRGNGATAGVLARLRAVDPGLFGQVVSAGREGDHVVLEAGVRRLLVRPDASVEELQNMAAVAEHLAGQGRAWRELDVRFAGRVIVRGMGS